MPLIKSAIKRARQNTVRNTRLRPFRTYMRTMMKKMEELVHDKKKTEAEKLLPEVFKSIDTAVKKRILHKNNAARKKSNMSKLLAGLTK